MPLTHLTGVNLLGKFNDNNTTCVENQNEIRESQFSATEDFGSSQQNARSSQNQQFSLGEFRQYHNYWNIQKYLNNPFLIFKPDGILDFEEQNTEIDGELNDYGEIGDNKSDDSFAGADPVSSKQTPKVLQQRDSKEIQKSNLQHVITIMKSFLEKFNQQPLTTESSNAQIQDKYPKYLSKFSLLNLQFNDNTFRVTFLTQVAIFLETLQNPMTASADQIKYFKLSADDLALIKELQNVTNTKGLKQSIFESEQQWLKWKNNKCQKYELPCDLGLKSKLDARRQAKLESKHFPMKPLIPQDKKNLLNKHQGATQMHKCLRADANKEQENQPSLSKFLLPVLRDIDPEQGIEDDYKSKHNQLLSWRLLRAIAETDLKNFSGEGHQQQSQQQVAGQKPKSQFKFEGNIEVQAQILLGCAKKEKE